jgi:hypothetical protein
MREDVVTAAYPIESEAGPPQRGKNLPRIRGRQAGAHAAMVIFRTVGDMSLGMGKP